MPAVRLSTDRPSTYRSRSSTSGSIRDTAALNTGATMAASATRTSIAATGIPGASPISRPGTARSSIPPVMTARGGSRSASEENSAPPITCGPKPMPNASAARNADRVCAYTTTDRPRISNSKPSTYRNMLAHSTRNCPTANTDRYVVRGAGAVAVVVMPPSSAAGRDVSNLSFQGER